jgi:hypothetical protein
MIARLCQAPPPWPRRFPDATVGGGRLAVGTYPWADPALRKPAQGRGRRFGPGRQAPTIIGASDP